MAEASGGNRRFSVDMADLGRFTEQGSRHHRRLATLFDRLGGLRRRVVARLGGAGPPGSGGSCDELLACLADTDRFAESVATSFESADGSGRRSSRADGGGAGDIVGRMVSRLVDPLDDLVVDAVPIAVTASRLGGRMTLGPLYPAVARTTNGTVTPAVVMSLWALVGRFAPPAAGGGDLGGTFGLRPTGFRLLDVEGRPAARGRAAVRAALDDTADGTRIRQDEFQLIRHDDHIYSIVLAGVTDLSRPSPGFHPEHRSVRDVDVVAVRSASSSSMADNLYARMVGESLAHAGVPLGSSLAIIGHSQGADTALDLAADPGFNGRDYTVTHAVAAAYHSWPQLTDVQPGTRVLVLQNNKDIPVMVENLGRLDPDPWGTMVGRPPPGVVVRRFDGGWAGAGHDQVNYASYLGEGARDAELDHFFSSMAAGGYTRPGRAHAVDISIPAGGLESGRGRGHV